MSTVIFATSSQLGASTRKKSCGLLVAASLVGPPGSLIGTPVCMSPRTGILCDARRRKKRQHKPAHPRPATFWTDSTHQYRRIRGVWYELMYLRHDPDKILQACVKSGFTARNRSFVQAHPLMGAAGLRDDALLQSALARHQQLYTYADNPDIIGMAPVYTTGIAGNQAFVDGNKSTGFVVGILFLELNGHHFTATEETATQAVLELAAGALDEAGCTAFLRTNTETE